MFTIDETIIAQSSAHGCGVRGILRISGPLCVEACNAVFVPQFEIPDVPRAFKGNVIPWEPQRKVPCTLFYWPSGRGYTGQATVELHMPGSEPVLQAVMRKILALQSSDIRLANPGEFTLRAFLSGRIDLTQAEAVLGVIDAVDSKYLEVALAQLAGGIATPLNRTRENLLEILAHLEAGFDFADEDIEFISSDQLRLSIDDSIMEIEKLLEQISNRTQTGETPKVVLFGKPNTGKSSLYNKLIGESKKNNVAAIVSEIAGTTRDYLETPLTFGNVSFVLVDTAGWNLDLNSESDRPDLTAQKFTETTGLSADVLLHCCENEYPEDVLPIKPNDGIPVLEIITKCDDTTQQSNEKVIRTSARTGVGIELLKDRILKTLLQGVGCPDVVPATALRCGDSLLKTKECLISAKILLDQTDEFLVASELRTALDHLGQIVGAVHTDDILDRIFSKFCLGK